MSSIKIFKNILQEFDQNLRENVNRIKLRITIRIENLRLASVKLMVSMLSISES